MKSQVLDKEHNILSEQKMNYAHDALCGLAMTKSSDDELLDGYLQDKYGK